MRTLLLVRHGATAWNEGGYCQGHKDVRLSAGGRRQIELLREALAPWSVGRAFASPLARAQETARLLGCEPEVLPELIEIDRGHWEGHEGPEIKRRWGNLWKRWYDDPSGLAMPGGESFDDLWARAGRVLDRLDSTGDEECVLACAHKAINRVLLARALALPTKGVWDIPQPQAGLSVLLREGDAWRAETLGSVAHLPPELRSDS